MINLEDFDLTTDAERGFDLTLKDPYTGKSTDVVFSVIGSDSRAYRSAKAEAFRANLKTAREDGEQEDADELNARIYAKCVRNWEGLSLKGQPLEYSPENALTVLKRFPWISDQIAAAVENRLNFTKPPEKN